MLRKSVAEILGLFAGIAIGSVILLEAMFAGPICGAALAINAKNENRPH